MNGEISNMSPYTVAMRILHEDPEVLRTDPVVDPTGQVFELMAGLDKKALENTALWVGRVLVSIDPNSQHTPTVKLAAEIELARRNGFIGGGEST